MKVRRYLHFDEPISPKRALEFVAKPELVQHWQFMPVVRLEIATRRVKRKPGKVLEPSIKIRPICYASHRDAALYEYYAWALNDAYDLAAHKAGFDASITAFRQNLGKCNIHFAAEAFSEIGKRDCCIALAFDVKSFFDTLDHKLLKVMWSKALDLPALPADQFQLYKSVTRYAFVERSEVYKRFSISKHNPRANRRRQICSIDEFRHVVREQGLIKVNDTGHGIPQGLPISAVLSNIYMLDFDAVVSAFCKTIGAAYFRYCDDILLVVTPADARRAQDFVEQEIKRSKLEIQPAKTTSHEFKLGQLIDGKPLQYLGFTFDGQTVLLRSTGLTRYYNRMRAAVRLADNTRRSKDAIGSTKTKLKTKKLRGRFSYLGYRTFLTYAFKASAIIDDAAIKGQVKAHWKKLEAEINKKEAAYL